MDTCTDGLDGDVPTVKVVAFSKDIDLGPDLDTVYIQWVPVRP